MSCCSSFARTMTNVYPCSFWRNPCILCYPLSYVSSRYTKQWTRILHWLEWNCFVASHYYGIRKNAKLISLCQTTLKNALNKFQHPQPAYPQHALHKHMPKRCGTQYLPQDDKDAPLSNPQSKWVEEIVCSQPNFGMCLKLNHNQANTWYNSVLTGMPSITWLCCYSSSCSNNICCKQHDFLCILMQATYLNQAVKVTLVVITS